MGGIASLTILLLAGVSVAAGQTESVLYAFQGQSANDGYYPEFDPLVMDSAGNLYGTTTNGGGTGCQTVDSRGCGIVFQLSPPPGGGSAPWTENVIWRFQGGADGGYPGALWFLGHRLYGYAATGGAGACAEGCGYIFEMIPPSSPGGAWTKMPLYDFPSADQLCGITVSDPAGRLYGVGPSKNGNGSVCEVSPPATSTGTWSEHTLYTFKGVAAGESLGDGSGPLGVTFDSKGNLWGATVDDGYCQLFEGGSCFGTIFVVTPPAGSGGAWTENVAYRFSNADQNPTSPVVVDKAGAVFGITYTETYKFSEGVLTVIDAFTDTGVNARAPTGGVVLDSAGNLYGTTGAGGLYDDGTVYELTPPSSGSGQWTQTILHSFEAGTDGQNPEAPMIIGPKGTLYGTTQVGGNQGCLGLQGDVVGCGIVFEVVP